MGARWHDWGRRRGLRATWRMLPVAVLLIVWQLAVSFDVVDRAFLPAAYRKRISELFARLRGKYGIRNESRWQSSDKAAPKHEQMQLF